MKKRHQCIKCNKKATAFLHYDGGYLPFCVEHFLQANFMIINKFLLLEDSFLSINKINEYMWKRK